MEQGRKVAILPIVATVAADARIVVINPVIIASLTDNKWLDAGASAYSRTASVLALRKPIDEAVARAISRNNLVHARRNRSAI